MINSGGILGYTIVSISAIGDIDKDMGKNIEELKELH